MLDTGDTMVNKMGAVLSSELPFHRQSMICEFYEFRKQGIVWEGLVKRGNQL